MRHARPKYRERRWQVWRSVRPAVPAPLRLTTAQETLLRQGIPQLLGTVGPDGLIHAFVVPDLPAVRITLAANGELWVFPSEEPS